MSGCIVVSDPLVDELIGFTEEICARSPGWYRAECDMCDAYTTGAESGVEDWAYEHVDSRHRGGRHTAFLREHVPLTLYGVAGRHRRSAALLSGDEFQVIWLGDGSGWYRTGGVASQFPGGRRFIP